MTSKPEGMISSKEPLRRARRALWHVHAHLRTHRGTRARTPAYRQRGPCTCLRSGSKPASTQAHAADNRCERASPRRAARAEPALHSREAQQPRPCDHASHAVRSGALAPCAVAQRRGNERAGQGAPTVTSKPFFTRFMAMPRPMMPMPMKPYLTILCRESSASTNHAGLLSSLDVTGGEASRARIRRQ